MEGCYRLKENNRNGQLERFFQHNPIEDPLYLKKYVKEHPDHKMAWYLLGREYAAQGKEGKAAYCFAQSGEIYEAFERQKIAVEGPIPSYPASSSLKEIEASLKNKASNNRYRRKIGKWIGLLVMLLLIAFPASFEAAKDKHPSIPIGAIAKSEGMEVIKSTSQDTVSKEKLYFAEDEWGALLQHVLSISGPRASESIIMEAPKSTDGKWIEWNKAVKPILGIVNESGGGNAAALKYYNSQVCSCQVADSSKLVPVIESWMQDREQATVIQSAIQAYQQKTGALPEKVDQLAKPYPDNLLPGVSPAMQSIFPQLIDQFNGKTKAMSGSDIQDPAELNKGKTTDKELSVPNSAQPKASTEPLVEPLRIIIDTEKHRLALVSGKFVIRNYPVGLGGEKTPEGEFTISEKVRNPNGKSDGEFGSRGMTLSDTLYAIHGTNKPSSIGKDESHGCVRMQQADIEELYDMVPGLTKVTIGKALLPDSAQDDGSGAGRGNPLQSFKLPLQTNDSNPNKKYKWLD
jgi:lipoprotein-anchoring transpeptidase ErfK/SrfK